MQWRESQRNPIAERIDETLQNLEDGMKRGILSNDGCATVCIIIVVALFLGLCIWGAVLTYRSKTAAAPFEGMEQQAREFCTRCFSESSNATAGPYLRGKVLVVEADTGEVSGSTMADLPTEIGAAGPEEVSTLVCAGEVEQRHVRTYTDGEPGYRLSRDICIYDLVEERIISVETLSGCRPDTVKHGRGPKSGSDPIYKELIAFLERMHTR